MDSANLLSPRPGNKSNRHLPDDGPGTMERRADKTAETRERIERAALKHFVEQGIAEPSIRDIADEARISLGAMYNHFKSKEELAWQLFINGWNEFGEALSRCEAAQPDLPSKLRAMIDHVFHRFDQDWLFVTYVFSSRHQHLKRVFTPTGRARANPHQVFRHVIAQAMRRGEIPEGELDLKTTLVIGAVIQTIDSSIIGRFEGPLREYALPAADLCIRMLKG